MRCADRDIQDLLPAFREGVLDDGDAARVRDHLARCRDCAEELGLLRALADEPVPDPGEAFWAALPDRVWREAQRADRPREDRLRFWPREWLPRWTLGGAAAFALALLVVWMLARPAGRPLPPPDTSAGAAVPAEDLYGSAASVADLGAADIDLLDSWVGKEVEQLRNDLGSVAYEPNGTDKTLDEYLSTLDRNDLESLAARLSRTQEAGS